MQNGTGRYSILRRKERLYESEFEPDASVAEPVRDDQPDRPVAAGAEEDGVEDVAGTGIFERAVQPVEAGQTKSIS